MQYQYHAVIDNLDTNTRIYAVFNNYEDTMKFFDERQIPDSKRSWGAEMGNHPVGAEVFKVDFQRHLDQFAAECAAYGTTE